MQRLVPRSRLVLILGRSEHVVASQEHARDSHEAALALRETGRFVKVEADIPIRGYAEEENVEDILGAFAPPLDWVHTTLRWSEALTRWPRPYAGGAASGSASPTPATAGTPT